jgi:NAD(P)-dependent dehydrogenase (short-subunit alcohol dehydrogenase family)
MRTIAVGGAGTIGRAVVEHLSIDHDVVVAGLATGDIHVDISSSDSVRRMYEQARRFDAVVCTAGEAHFGPFDAMTEDDLALGVHSKLLGQIRLVMLGYQRSVDGWRTGEVIHVW